MAITLHCESCKKKINAPDTAGGKWGKCPFCGHKCYIPSPPDDNEEPGPGSDLPPAGEDGHSEKRDI